MTPRFVQLHLLTDYTAVLLNRDENGVAKRLPKGGFVRTRISSQCLKRHMRLAKGPYALTNIAPDPLRTKELVDTRIIAAVRDRIPNADGETIEAAMIQLNIELYGKDGNDSKKRQLLLFGRPEIDWLQNHVTDAVRTFSDPGEVSKAVASLFNGTHAQHNFTAFRTSVQMPAGIIGAMNGRMVTADPLARIDGALHVAHAFTIHEEASEIDFFTAMDDLRSEQQGGSGFLSTTELNSGVFYFYMCVDVPTLVSNTTGCAPEDWLDADPHIAAQAAANIAGLAATVTAGAKKGSTAPQAYAQVLLAEIGESMPRSLAGAFTVPAHPTVQDGLAKMQEHLNAHDRMYGKNEARMLMADNGTKLDDIHAWIRTSIEEGQLECPNS